MRRGILLVVAVVIIAVQFIPVQRDGPPPEGPLQAPADVAAVLQRSCYDCHSSETIWPWYSRIAPVSWYLAHHVEEARAHLDFSRWGLLSKAEIAKVRAEIIEEVESGEMPLPIYLTMHDEARIAPADLAILRRWAESGATADDHDHDH